MQCGLFVPFSPHAQKHFLYSKHVERLSQTFYLHICVALSIHCQHATYIESVTLTQLFTLSCQCVDFKVLLKTNRDRIDVSGWC